MSSTVTPMKLRSAIAETLWDCVKAQHLEAACDALGMAPAPEGSAEPFNSKRSYVQGRLQGTSLTDLTDLAHRVAAEYDAEHLQPLLDALGVHGVAGELKNLIFAADGPKPRIVLRDAVNNVIDIVENAQYCLVDDRPLAEHGLTWRALVKWWSEQHPGPGTERDHARELYNRLVKSRRQPGGGDRVPRLRRVLRLPRRLRLAGPHSAGVPALRPVHQTATR